MRQFVIDSPRDPIFFIGTRAELIKVAPVLSQLKESGCEFKVLWAGLHAEPNLPGNKRVLCFPLSGSDSDKGSILSVFRWFLINLIKVAVCGFQVRASKSGPQIVIVHGDTLCTVLGALFAKAAGAKLMHIEAGVRSGSFWRPFPEEISRRFVSRVTDIHFAPGDREASNLIGSRSEVINTLHNTSRDALTENTQGLAFGDDGYLLVTLHRTELLSNKNQFKAITSKILELSQSFEVRWFLGNHERESLGSIGFLEKVSGSKIQLLERTSHENFVKVLSRAHCVITDSGGLQSECNDLGIPVIVHRNESEYSNLDNSPCVMTKWNLAIIDEFLKGLKDNALPRGVRSQAVASKIIATRLVEEVAKD